MRILTVGESPYRLTAAGRINKELIYKLRAKGHQVSTASWAYDRSWFLQDEEDKYWYETDEEKICQVFPFVNHADKAAPQVYEIMKEFQPDAVISVGGYEQTAFLFSVKAIYPDLFKWYAIMLIDAGPLREEYEEAFAHIDALAVTNKEAKEYVAEISNVDCHVIPYGYNDNLFYEDGREFGDQGTLRVLMVCQNTVVSNLAAYIDGVKRAQDIVGEKGIDAYLHVNLFESGFYDLYSLSERFGSVRLPDMFVSSNDGESDDDMRRLYNWADVVVDCSMASATGLTVLEGMACGAVPLINPVGALKDIADGMQLDSLQRLNSVSYIGHRGRNYSVVNPEGIGSALGEMYHLKRMGGPSEMEKARNDVISYAKSRPGKEFFAEVEDITREYGTKKSVMVLTEINK